jgi:hypothetical protein
MSKRNDNWKTQTYIRGSLIGLIVGIIASYLYTRAAEEHQLMDGKNELTPIGASDMVKISLSILALVRQITELGSSK